MDRNPSPASSRTSNTAMGALIECRDRLLNDGITHTAPIVKELQAAIDYRQQELMAAKPLPERIRMTQEYIERRTRRVHALDEELGQLAARTREVRRQRAALNYDMAKKRAALRGWQQELVATNPLDALPEAIRPIWEAIPRDSLQDPALQQALLQVLTAVASPPAARATARGEEAPRAGGPGKRKEPPRSSDVIDVDAEGPQEEEELSDDPEPEAFDIFSMDDNGCPLPRAPAQSDPYDAPDATPGIVTPPSRGPRSPAPAQAEGYLQDLLRRASAEAAAPSPPSAGWPDDPAATPASASSPPSAPRRERSRGRARVAAAAASSSTAPLAPFRAARRAAAPA